ncbi:uncharacterized protein Dwil_GK24905 [Drosophila willistoni]|uniref:Uncharacterized protein n=1 Tax=Drosophila willistoni TaxID=7260 RepID=B4NDJ5_DROWI|nr:uncharacterized protein LOC6648934 [Drosophila willistoni]EDW82901.1 uncharacterized protein Dwil_GK24905 [Drosophila willistoni]
MSTVRPGTDVLAKVGDCSKLKLDEIDLISRTLKCEQEIFHYDEKLSFTPTDSQGDGAEEEEILIPTTEDGTDDEDHLNQTLNALDCLIQRIEQTQFEVEKRKEKKLKETAAAFFSLDDPIDCEDELQISNLEHAHHNLQCEIDRVHLYYRELSHALMDSMKMMCQLEKQIILLDDIALDYKEWADETADLELNVCPRRHKELNNTMITKKEIKTVTKGYEESAFKRSYKCVKKHQVTDEISKFYLAMDEMMQLTDDLKAEMEKRYAKLEELANSYIQRVEEESTKA